MLQHACIDDAQGALHTVPVFIDTTVPCSCHLPFVMYCEPSNYFVDLAVLYADGHAVDTCATPVADDKVLGPLGKLHLPNVGISVRPLVAARNHAA